jgi:hypothetical protein
MHIVSVIQQGWMIIVGIAKSELPNEIGRRKRELGTDDANRRIGLLPDR